MSSAAIEEKVSAFQSAVKPVNRIGVSEFARSREWREQLPEVGCLEVVDRNGVVGYMLAPDYARALSERITELEEREERVSIAAMFRTREGCSNLETGDELRKSVRSRAAERAEELAAIVNGD